MKRLAVWPELVEAASATAIATITDDSAPGTLIAGYMIVLKGTFAGATGITPIADIGQITMSSAAGGSLINEINGGFMAERTRMGKGSTRFIATAGAGNKLLISLFHEFDISLDFSHGNIFVVGPGDTLSFTLPAIAAAISTDAVWEVHRLTVDRGEAHYIPRYNSRGFTLSELTVTMPGHFASVQMQASSGTDPARVSIFDGNNKRKGFLSWESALAWSNAMNRYDADECSQFYFSAFSEDPQSITKCYGTLKTRLEATAGTGTSLLSVCTVDPAPAGARSLAKAESISSERVNLGRIQRNGIEKAAVIGLIGASQTMAPITPSTQVETAPVLAVEMAPVGNPTRAAI